MSSNLPPIPKSKTATPPHVKYVRNFDQVKGDMKSEDLMTETLSNDFLYSTINVGAQAAHFFTDTMVGADFDRRMRERFANGFADLLAADPHDAGAVMRAQQECHVVIGIYDTVALQIQERFTAEKELSYRDGNDDTEQGD